MRRVSAPKQYLSVLPAKDYSSPVSFARLLDGPVRVTYELTAKYRQRCKQELLELVDKSRVQVDMRSVQINVHAHYDKHDPGKGGKHCVVYTFLTAGECKTVRESLGTGRSSWNMLDDRPRLVKATLVDTAESPSFDWAAHLERFAPAVRLDPTARAGLGRVAVLIPLNWVRHAAVPTHDCAAICAVAVQLSHAKGVCRNCWEPGHESASAQLCRVAQGAGIC